MTRSHLALMLVVLAIAGAFIALSRHEETPTTEAHPYFGDWPTPRGYVCYRASTAPTIDGKLDDAVWASVPWSEPFRDIEGNRQPEPRLRTRMKMVWDDHALYIAAELEEPHLWASIREHDAVIFHDHDFEVFLDPDCDSHLYAELELNAFNTTWDLLLSKPYKDGGLAVNAWEITGLKTAVHLDGTVNNPSDIDRGWTIEIAWPWAGLNELAHKITPPKNGDQWRINFSRVEWDMVIEKGGYVKIPKRPEHNWVWSPQGVIDMHRPERWGIVQFASGPVGSATFHPDPAQAARDYLHQIYYAQTIKRKADGSYFSSLANMSLPILPRDGVLAHPTLETTTSGYIASVDLRTAGDKKQRWSVSEDGRFGRR